MVSSLSYNHYEPTGRCFLWAFYMIIKDVKLISRKIECNIPVVSYNDKGEGLTIPIPSSNSHTFTSPTNPRLCANLLSLRGVEAGVDKEKAGTVLHSFEDLLDNLHDSLLT